MSEDVVPLVCPECQHATVQALAGKCTVFVPTPDGPQMADYCGCDCYKVATGETMMDTIRRALWGEGGHE